MFPSFLERLGRGGVCERAPHASRQMPLSVGEQEGHRVASAARGAAKGVKYPI